MLELNPNTLAFMTAALEKASRQLKIDCPGSRKFIADRLLERAKSGHVTMAALTEAGESAAAELNRDIKKSGGWRNFFRWKSK
jgi:hypothetical protein